jgi:uncharacterized protein YutE (UPF0331/DUF86 family)
LVDRYVLQARRLTAMAGFRNILVHEYLEIDRRKVYAVLKKDLGNSKSSFER